MKTWKNLEYLLTYVVYMSAFGLIDMLIIIKDAFWEEIVKYIYFWLSRGMHVCTCM